MIHDAMVEVTCDGERCQKSIYFKGAYVRIKFTGGGHYDATGQIIERHLPREDWVVIDGKHYCGPDCAGIDEPEN